MHDSGLSNDLELIEHLDFDPSSDDECNLREACDNKATWILTMTCCATEYKVCDEHRANEFRKLRDWDRVNCRVCAYSWLPRNEIILKWSKL